MRLEVLDTIAEVLADMLVAWLQRSGIAKGFEQYPKDGEALLEFDRTKK